MKSKVMKSEDRIKVYDAERILEYDKWIRDIPYIKFPASWEVQITPPFGGAVVRFRVMVGSADVSIYLDCYDLIGFYGEPYWEIYPLNDDVYRCDMNDTTSLLTAISDSINEQQLKKD